MNLSTYPTTADTAAVVAYSIMSALAITAVVGIAVAVALAVRKSRADGKDWRGDGERKWVTVLAAAVTAILCLVMVGGTVYAAVAEATGGDQPDDSAAATEVSEVTGEPTSEATLRAARESGQEFTSGDCAVQVVGPSLLIEC